MQTRTISNEELVLEIDRLLKEGTEVIFKPKGQSMLPFIRGERDSVLLKNPGVIKPGYIVLAKVSEKNFVLHRVEHVAGDRVVLMGDGNLVGRERCRMSDVIAVAVKIIKVDKETDCLSKKHMRRALLWKRLLPVRRYLLAIYRRVIL